MSKIIPNAYLSGYYFPANAPQTYVLDDVSGALAAWGLRPLKAAMIGQNGFKLNRTSDNATQDFAFEDSGTPIATVDAWKGAEPAWPVLGASINTLYDQTGNARHLVQTDVTKQWGWLKSAADEVLGTCNGNNFGRDAVMPVPNFSQSSRDLTTYIVCRSNDATYTGHTTEDSDMPVFGFQAGGGYIGLTTTAASTFNKKARVWDWNSGPLYTDNQVRPSNCHLNIFAIRWNATNTILSVNDQIVFTDTAVLAGTLTSGILGQLSTFAIGGKFSQWLACFLYPAHTAGQMTTTIAAIRSQFGLAAWTHNVVFDGDSITAGHQDAMLGYDIRYLSWPFLLHQQMDRPALRFSNVAISSETLTSLESAAAAKVDTIYDNTLFPGKNILVIFAGTNDIAAGASAATAFSRLQTYVNNRTSAGWTVLICNMIPRENFDASMETNRQTFNSTVLSAYPDVLIDLASLGWSYGTHYQGSTPNRIHPNAAGRQLIADAVQTELASWL